MGSIPIVDINKPKKPTIIPLIIDPLDTDTMIESPNTAKAKYSADPNWRANFEICGDKTVIISAPDKPPTKDEKTDKSGNVKVEKEEVVPATPSVEIKSNAETLPDLFKDMDEELPKTEVSVPIVAVKDILDLEKKEKDVVP